MHTVSLSSDLKSGDPVSDQWIPYFKEFESTVVLCILVIDLQLNLIWRCKVTISSILVNCDNIFSEKLLHIQLPHVNNYIVKI